MNDRQIQIFIIRIQFNEKSYLENIVHFPRNYYLIDKLPCRCRQGRSCHQDILDWKDKCWAREHIQLQRYQ